MTILPIRPVLACACTISLACAQVSWKQVVADSTRILVNSATYDSKRNEIIATAYDTQAKTGVTLRYTGRAMWQYIGTNSLPLVTAASTYDVARDRIVVVTTSPTPQTWEWDGTTWARNPAVSPIDTTQLFYNHKDATVQTITWTGSNLKLWSFDGIAWKRRPTSNPPLSRTRFASACDRDGNIYVFGGMDYTSELSETLKLVWQSGVWLRITGNGPSARFDSQMSHDPTRDRIVLYGGRSYGSTSYSSYADTWELTSTGWKQRAASLIASESRRCCATLFWNDARERTMLVGGLYVWGPKNREYSNSFSDVHEFGPDNPASLVTFGKGCASNLNAPALAAIARPWIGETVAFDIVGVRSTTPLLWTLGLSNQTWGSAPLPLSLGNAAPACSVLVEPSLVQTTTSRVRYPIPADRTLVGQRYFHQAIAIDRGANALGLVLSDGLELVVGEQ